jgi:hypothetical protein
MLRFVVVPTHENNLNLFYLFGQEQRSGGSNLTRAPNNADGSVVVQIIRGTRVVTNQRGYPGERIQVIS